MNGESFQYHPSTSCCHSEFASKELHAEVSSHTRHWPPACQCDHASAPSPTPKICENQGILAAVWNPHGRFEREIQNSQLTSSYKCKLPQPPKTFTSCSLLQALQRIVFMSHIHCLARAGGKCVSAEWLCGSCSISAYFYWLLC